MQKTDRASLRRNFVSAIGETYGQREAEAIFFLVASRLLDLNRIDFILEPNAQIEYDAERLENIISGLCANRPVQHLLGVAEFCGMDFEVSGDVLIPRPETEELVVWVVETLGGRKTILDIGTGSGAIAVALAVKTECNVSAVDISSEALAIATANAARNGAKVDFARVDILCEIPQGKYDIIVSNPPYVPESDKNTMSRNVLDYEPELALFVSDDDPLVFYRTIAQVGRKILNDNGLLFFEIYEHYAAATVAMLAEQGYKEIEVRRDIHSKERMIRCRL